MKNFRMAVLPWSRLAAALLLLVVLLVAPRGSAQVFAHTKLVALDAPVAPGDFALVRNGEAAPIYLDPSEEKILGAAVAAFASDVEKVTGIRPRIFTAWPNPAPARVILVGVSAQSPVLQRFGAKLALGSIDGKWESSLTTVVSSPLPGVEQALVIAGSDRRGAAFALFALSRQMGVSPWTWWADVPVAHHSSVAITAHNELAPEPSVRYRGIFLNDEDWGLRPWAAKKMDPALGNVGPRTYERIFELLLRLHANSLWPAMHPKTLAFNAVAENAQLADRWGIVMGSSHSEALLRNNVGEWDEKRDGPWNYQLNRTAIDAYWNDRLTLNGKYENFYTVGMRGVHDTGLEATGSVEVKARLVEQAMASQRAMLAQHVNADLVKVPQVIWLYKESLELYRAGMKVPDDVTLGWTDDNYGYIRQLPTREEQKRAGGSALYYHVSYWGFPHDYLWLCSTPPALMREELTKAYDHGVRQYWILNVGDIKPAEADIDYFLQLGWNEQAMARIDQRAYLQSWLAEQFPTADAPALAATMDEYFQLNFLRKPEFLGFNGYNDGVKRTDFNPLAWGGSWGQNGARLADWNRLVAQEQVVAKTVPESARSAFFELVGYPVEAAAAQNRKFLFADRAFLDAKQHNEPARVADATQSHEAYKKIQQLTTEYNQLEGGKWAEMMSSAPRNRHVFEMPELAFASAEATPLPASWAADASAASTQSTQTSGSTDKKETRGFVEEHATVSINAAHFTRHFDGTPSTWRVMADLGLSGGSVVYGFPGQLANLPEAKPETVQPWLEYAFVTKQAGAATLDVDLLPTFPVDSAHRLRFGVSVDGGPVREIDVAGAGEWKENSAPTWEKNVLRNAAIFTLPVDFAQPGPHTVRLIAIDPGAVFEHLVVRFSGAPPAYPVPPETVGGK
jgi:hypothetical protein